LTPPCATALLDLRCTLGALVAPRLRHRLVLLLLLLNRPPCATRLAGALRPLAVRALYACERVDLGTNGCVLEGGIGRDEGATRTVRTLSSSIYLGSKKWTGNGQIHSHSLYRAEHMIFRPRRAAAAPAGISVVFSRKWCCFFPYAFKCIFMHSDAFSTFSFRGPRPRAGVPSCGAVSVLFNSILESISEVTRLSRLTSHEPRTRPLSRGASRALEEARGTHALRSAETADATYGSLSTCTG